MHSSIDKTPFGDARLDGVVCAAEALALVVTWNLGRRCLLDTHLVKPVACSVYVNRVTVLAVRFTLNYDDQR